LLQDKKMNTTLSVAEQQIVGLMRELPPAALQEVHDFVAFLVARHCGWTYGDRPSVERAVDSMACDPFLQREIHAINDDFACAESDGLEEA
jgi:hypothetical protein